MPLANCEVDQDTYGDNDYTLWGETEDAGMGWNTYQTNDALMTFSGASNVWVFGTKANVYDPGQRDFGFPAQCVVIPNSYP